MTGPALFLCVGIRRGSPAPVIGPDRVVPGRWTRVVSRRISPPDDLAGLEAVLPAYAPPPVPVRPAVR